MITKMHPPLVRPPMVPNSEPVAVADELSAFHARSQFDGPLGTEMKTLFVLSREAAKKKTKI